MTRWSSPSRASDAGRRAWRPSPPPGRTPSTVRTRGRRARHRDRVRAGRDRRGQGERAGHRSGGVGRELTQRHRIRVDRDVDLPAGCPTRRAQLDGPTDGHRRLRDRDRRRGRRRGGGRGARGDGRGRRGRRRGGGRRDVVVVVVDGRRTVGWWSWWAAPWCWWSCVVVAVDVVVVAGSRRGGRRGRGGGRRRRWCVVVVAGTVVVVVVRRRGRVVVVVAGTWWWWPGSVGRGRGSWWWWPARWRRGRTWRWWPGSSSWWCVHRRHVGVHDRPRRADDLDVGGVVGPAGLLARSRRLDPQLVQAEVRITRGRRVGEARL